ncbi:BAG domain [Musa troglodytarum]|uniref:BAG domain n=1 Tax=Musa troglodytarum TaxID=320322 RepID=A0A9E7GXG5_9LILI|nr:BAG domain [Musa troglodytarum]
MGNVVARLLGCRPTFRDEEEQPATKDEASKRSRQKQKYACIPDNYTSIEQVTDALRDAGLESSNLILGIDFTRSNEWTGKRSFHDLSLHNISNHRLNPYQQAIAIIGKVLASFDEDNLIPCFGFGDCMASSSSSSAAVAWFGRVVSLLLLLLLLPATTRDQGVFSFRSDHSPCHGFEEVLRCYREIVPHLQLSGPTSFAPIVETAVYIAESSGGQYHVLVIIADGQVSRDPNKEPETIESIVMASAHPSSIVLVGVGDGPWDDMKKFDDRIPARDFDNFQFVNFTDIMGRNASAAETEAAFALAALMEIPIQYKATVELGILGEAQATRAAASSIAAHPKTLRSSEPEPKHSRGSSAEETLAQSD